MVQGYWKSTWCEPSWTAESFDNSSVRSNRLVKPSPAACVYPLHRFFDVLLIISPRIRGIFSNLLRASAFNPKKWARTKAPLILGKCIPKSPRFVSSDRWFQVNPNAMRNLTFVLFGVCLCLAQSNRRVLGTFMSSSQASNLFIVWFQWMFLSQLSRPGGDRINMSDTRRI